jgi:cell division protein YceG involved in septum cleavage
MTDVPRSSSGPSPAAPRRRGRLRRACLVLLALLAGGGAYVVRDAHHFLTTPACGEGKEIRISIRHKATLGGVAADLARAGAITDARRFRLLALYRRAQGQIRAGEFMVNSGWTPDRILEQITTGQPILDRLFLREGLPWWETAKSIEEQGFAAFADFKAVIHDPDFLREHQIPFASAEGFLFPETYLLRKPRGPLDREQARAVASMLVQTFWRKTAPAWNHLPLRPGVVNTAARRAASRYAPPLPQSSNATVPAQAALPDGKTGARPDLPSPLPQSRNATLAASLPSVSGNATLSPLSGPVSREEDRDAPAEWKDNGPQDPADVDPAALGRLVILASLVEKETAVPAERPRVAGVYANRLRLGMLLQCDPTVIYGVGPEFSGSIRRSQLQDAANPYNTYKHSGLPPGPICSPGLAALLAAARPERNDFIYFVATGLGDGSHVFSRTTAEHNAAVREYRARIRGGLGK